MRPTSGLLRRGLRDPALFVVLAACLVGALVLVGLPLAYVDGFHAYLVLPAALLVTGGLLWLLNLERGALSATPTGWWVGALLIAAISALVNGRLAAEHSVVTRDPGVYSMTARWLVLHHDLTMPGLTGPFAGQLSAGLAPAPGDQVEFQFVHGLPVLQAVGNWLLGELGLYRTPAVLAALALVTMFGLALELLRPAWAFAATLLVAISLPVVYVARDAYSESVMLIMLTSGAWMLLSALRAGSRRRAGLAGVLLGSSACARIDFMVYGLALAPVVLWLGTLRGNCEPDSSWRSGGRRALLVGLVPGVAIGWLDLRERSAAYLGSQREPLLQATAATAALIVLGVVLTRPPIARWLRARWQRHRGRLAVACVAGLVLAAVLAIAQPVLRTDRDAELMVPRAGIFESLQRLEGVSPTDPERTFYEYAGHWIAWYHGWPAFVLAVGGAALLLWRVVRGEARAAEGVVVAFVLVPLALIIAKPSIYPDQPWAARRMVPLALPGALLLATAGLGWGVEYLRGRGRLVARTAVAVGLLALFLPAVITTGRVAGFQESAGLQRPINAVCAAVPDDAPLLVLAEAPLASGLPGVLTTWCGVPASGPPPGVEARQLAAAWRAKDRVMWAVGTEAGLRQAGFQPVARGRTVMRHVLPWRLLGPPTGTAEQVYELWVGRPARVTSADPPGVGAATAADHTRSDGGVSSPRAAGPSRPRRRTRVRSSSSG